MDPADLEALLNDLPVAVVVQDAGAVIRYANRAALTLLEREPWEVVGISSFDPSWEAVHADGTDLPGDQHPVPIALATGVPVRGALMGVRRRRQGERVWIRVDAIPRLDVHGEIVDCVCTFVDVSEEMRAREDLVGRSHELRRTIDDRSASLTRTIAELRRKQAEADLANRRLEEYQAQIRAMLNAMSEGVVLHAGDGTIQFANPAAEAALGLTAQQMVGATPMDPRWGLVDEREAPLPHREVPSEMTRATGQPVRRKVLGVKLPDGGRRWLSVSSDPVDLGTNSQGQYSVVATFEDITAQRVAQNELASANRRFRSLADAIPGVLFEALDGENGVRFSFLSRRAASLLGLDIDGCPPVERLHEKVVPEDRDTLRSIWCKARRDGAAAEDFRMSVGGSDPCWLRLSMVHQQSEYESVFHGVIIDVTAERQLQDRLLRTQILESMTQVAAGVAHNFNNALAAVIPNIETAILGAPEHIRSPLHDASIAADGARRLVTQLLQAVKGDQIGPIIDVELGAVLGDVGRLCRGIFPGHIDLRVEVPSTAVFARGSVSRLQQILLNLAINARDAVEARPGRSGIVIVRPVYDVEHRKVGFQVQDDGIGMPPEVLARIGEPFFTTKPPGVGTGLGIPSVKGILAEIGGVLQVESQAGVGTTFTVWLQRTEGARVESEGRAPDRSLPPLDPHRIVLVDDDPYVRRAIRRTLERLGMSVQEAADADGAYRSVADGCDLVLLDLSMPKVGGAEVLEVLTTAWPETPVVILTGHVDHLPDLSRAVAVVRKPLKQDDLHRLLWRVFSREQHGNA
jgi:PAS domain S-box-containing protein